MRRSGGTMHGDSASAGRAADPLLAEGEGRSALLLGNEAIVRGALEAGVAFASGYPGTPSSEITDSFARLAAARGIAFEYSVNEKIALEMAFAASLAGARSICAMKHLGLMSAGDPLSTIPYVGTVAGMVIVSAGDPSCLTSPNEQDQRHLAPMLHLPMLDPATPRDALEMTRLAFALSEECRLPVILRPTTRVCHTRAAVPLGRLAPPRVAGFRRDPARFVPIPANARRLRVELKGRIEAARAAVEREGLLRRSGEGTDAVLAAGAPAATCEEALREIGAGGRVVFLRLGAVHPLPERALVAALQGVARVLVVEELSPFLEDALAALCARLGLRIAILGKRTGHFPEEFEYTPEVVRRGLRAGLGLGPPIEEPGGAGAEPPRPPILCPACPHRSAYFAARAAFGEDALYFNDIGCYTLGYGPPLETADALLCMGAGFTLAAGVSRMTGKRTVGFLGDSTFFHSGMPALLDAVKADADMVAVVLDNAVTAMTGFQESPMVRPGPGGPRRAISIEGVVRALGARHVEVVDPGADLPAAVAAFRRARDREGLSVVVVQGPCPAFLDHAGAAAAERVPCEVDQDLCRTCGREACGTRCGQGIAVPFERRMARARAMETGPAGTPRPAVAPCAERCPLNLCVQGYAAHIASGDYRAALDLIASRLPLPDTVCRVCHRPCEEVCVRAGIDEPVAINDLKRFVMDWAAAQPDFPWAPPREPPNGRRVAVVGAGPAGLAAAHELALRGYAVDLLDAGEEPGGILRTGIPGYRLPPEALDRDVARILALGVAFRGCTVLGKHVRLGDLLASHDAVFLALGARRGLRLDLATGNDGLPRVVDALEFLEASRRPGGVRAGRRVVVLGGGNSAVDAARSALRSGAEEVRIVCPEERARMPAIPEEIAEAERERVEIRAGFVALRCVSGGIEVARVGPTGPLAPGSAVPPPVPGSEAVLPAETVVLAVGQAPDRSFLGPGDPPLEWTPGGLLRVDPETGRTSHPRVSAGGDLVPGERSVVAAVAAGQRAAWGIDRSLRGPGAADRRPPPPTVALPAAPVLPGIDRIDRGRRRRPILLPPEERTRGFGEVVGALPEAEARAEAERCMICGLCGNCSACIDTFGCPAFFRKDGRIRIDPSLCTGCGVCARLCPNGAIRPATGRAVP